MKFISKFLILSTTVSILSPKLQPYYQQAANTLCASFGQALHSGASGQELQYLHNVTKSHAKKTHRSDNERARNIRNKQRERVKNREDDAKKMRSIA